MLRGLTLSADRGEVLAVLGPNGAGKTTLMSVIAGLLRPDGGSVQVLGTDVAGGAKALRGRLGLAGQEIAVYPVHTVEENLRFFGSLGGLRGRELTESVDGLIDALELTGQRGQRAAELSGGQQRRLHAGCALVHRPEVVLLDEPTAGADPQTRLRLLEVVQRQAARGTLVVYTTHYLAEVEELRARVVVLAGGRIVADGTVDGLIAENTRSELALRFDGEPPEIIWPGARVLADTVFLPTARPAVDIVKALEAVAGHRERLQGVEIARADLERAYFNILAGEASHDTSPVTAPA
ncbi:ABC transporter ATP-binding protein [Streptomyces sp. CB01881]|uniref:ABC transporter ATP-binding protein n=1 Tax=Streptomyces sp. CB01881 TaxID=2078691 RepID=UPI001ABFF1C9|nr:ABC transporter ATP-binding protein [Streptomyces sp. CB01881]